LELWTRAVFDALKCRQQADKLLAQRWVTPDNQEPLAILEELEAKSVSALLSIDWQDSGRWRQWLARRLR